jgi:uncharacterized damage-inducible protein DinB
MRQIELNLSETKVKAMSLDDLLKQYEQGPEIIRIAITGLRNEQLDAKPVPGRWSIRQVICHLADFEPIYADRMKRVLVEDNPTMFGGNPDTFAAGLHYEQRSVQEELELIQAVRRQLAVILRNTDVEDFQRTGVHSEAGPLTLETLLERITGHIPHHVDFIKAKVAAMS